tara:strand:- start:271 stop:462 length:192 start_codon:yes stop_codon:yes gene_type:complete
VNDTTAQIVQGVKQVGDITAVGLTVATIFKWLPAMAALLTIIWTAVRIYETDTVQKIINRRKP